MALGLPANGINPEQAWKLITNICQDARLKQTTKSALDQAATQVRLIEVNKENYHVIKMKEVVGVL